MVLSWWALIGLLAASLINRAADCWLSPVQLQCGLTRHPIRQWLIVVGLPVYFMLLAFWIHSEVRLWFACIFGAVLILLAVIDLEQRRIPDVITIPTMVLTIYAGWQLAQLVEVVVGALLGFVVFLALYAAGGFFYGREALGRGDVKLAALLGAILGVSLIPYALIGGIIAAGLFSLVLLMYGRVKRDSTIPYGFFLALAGAAVIMGQAILASGRLL